MSVLFMLLGMARVGKAAMDTGSEVVSVEHGFRSEVNVSVELCLRLERACRSQNGSQQQH